MTKIKNYPVDSNITDNDKLIGSDGDNGNITKNFTLSSLSSYFNSDLIEYINNIIGIGSNGSRLINPSYFNIPGTLQYIVQADAYIINGTLYNTPVNDTVTLSPSDSTNNRFDVIVVNIDGSVTSVTGTPATSPAVPLIDDQTQVTVTKVLVEANATQPSGVTTTLVFDENRQVAGDEWDTTASPALTIDLESAEQAENGVTSAKFAVESSDNYISFEDTSTYNGADLSTVRFGIYIKKPDNYRFSVKITNVDGDVASGIFFESGQYGFNNATINEWQIITIPASAFEGISSIVYDKIQFGNEGDNSEPFYFDFLQIQEGLEPISGGIPNYTLNFVGDELQLLKDGLVNSTVNLGEWFIPLSGTEVGSPVTGNLLSVENNDSLRIAGRFIEQLNSVENTGFLIETDGGFSMTNGIGSTSGKSGISQTSVSVGNGATSKGNILSTNITSNRSYQLPNKSGAFALLDDLNFIPLSGTEVGSPVTGNIVFDPYTRLEWKQDISYEVQIEQGEQFLVIRNKDLSQPFDIQFVLDSSNNTVNINSFDTTTKGLVGNVYFGANYDDNTYVQKKYVDDSINSHIGFVRYDGTESFSNGSEVTVPNGGSATMINTDPTPVVSFNNLDVYYTPPGGIKPLFKFDAINQVYVLTVVFKARTSDTNAAHIDLKFSVSGNTSYTRLSKSIDFYKGNNEIQNFHEVFQFYTDQDLVDNGMSLSFDAVGADVDYGDVIYFIQRCI